MTAVNVGGPFQMAHACASALRRSTQAAIVNVSSNAGFTGVGSSMAYAPSKAALNALTLSLARVLAPEIRVNAVAPGFTLNALAQQRYVRSATGANKDAFRVNEPSEAEYNRRRRGRGRPLVHRRRAKRDRS